MRTAVVALVVIVASIAGCCAASAQQWPASALALRTNGGALKAGECVRLALVATDDVTVPFQPVVRYTFSQTVTIEDEDKNTRNETRRVAVDRPPSAVIEQIGSGASVVLDDTFCFGQGTVPGAYEISVSLVSSGLVEARLATCIEFHADAADAQPPPAGCGLALRGVLRRDPGETVVLDAVGAAGGLNRLLVLRGERLLRVLQDGLAPTGPSELSIAGSAFAGLGPAPVDLVLHDQAGHRSATLARLVIGR
jgi:hypothetical protein